ncbi:MAG: ABC transporter [Rickettsiales bacterium]|nr:ABC transporter [Rickettsiales bacterium]
MSKIALELEHVSRHYAGVGETPLHILNDVSLKVRAGETVALAGPSGSGKSTLLHLAGLLDTPTTGEVFIGDAKTQGLRDRRKTKLRNRNIGFIYQFHHLLPELNALENVALPAMIARKRPAEAKERAAALLEQVGLAERMKHRPAELSGGEQQRVAIARALVNNPVLLLADEPTGNLDEHTAEHVFAMLQTLVADEQVALLMATHNMVLAERCDRLVRVSEGKLHEGAA